MADFVNRVKLYPVVGDTCKAVSDAYQWAKNKETVAPIISKVESAAISLASLVKPVIESNVVHTLDEMACRQLLDRFETLCPTLKEAPTEELLGPVANRALSLAETCADYCLVEDRQPIDGTEASRLARLSHLQVRARHQAISMFHSSIGRAHDMLCDVLDTGSQLSNTIMTTSVGTTLLQVVSILGFACTTAKQLSVPFILQGLTTVKDQTEKLDHQLKESGKLNWVDLQRIICALDTLRDRMREEHPEGEMRQALEMQPIPAGTTATAQEATSVNGSTSNGREADTTGHN